MSIALSDILTTKQPKRGVIPACIEAELTLGAFVPLDQMLVPEEHQPNIVRRSIIDRLYGDIAADFEKLLNLVRPHHEDFDRFEAQVKTIREKLAGQGPGQKLHSAPPVQ